MATDKKIGFLGAGAMAEALVGGWISKGVVQGSQIYAHDPNPARKSVFENLKANFISSGNEVRERIQIDA